MVHFCNKLREGHSQRTCECALAVDGREPAAVDVVEVVGADLLGAQRHRRHLVRLGRVHAEPRHGHPGAAKLA